MQAPGLGPVLTTALRGLSAISERLTDFALQYAPADASPGVVRVAVNAGLILLALSFVKSLLSVSRRCWAEVLLIKPRQLRGTFGSGGGIWQLQPPPCPPACPCPSRAPHLLLRGATRRACSSKLPLPPARPPCSPALPMPPCPLAPLQFFLTLGSIVLGAYVAVRVFGLDVAGISGSIGGGMRSATPATRPVTTPW